MNANYNHIKIVTYHNIPEVLFGIKSVTHIMKHTLYQEKSLLYDPT